MLLAMILIALAAAPRAEAQVAERCFAETGYCVSGRIREVWERNGGLPVFGYPITPLQQETIEGRVLAVQWFERGRLELHPQNPRPYDVQIGRIGLELLTGRRTAATPADQPAGECRVFPQTGRSACGAFLGAWRASGLELDGRPGKTEAESLALFGLPLTDPQVETLSNGRRYTVQWFERGRFELHPQGVLLGLLGREADPVAQAQPRVIPIARPPVRLVVPKIALDTRVVAAGVDRTGAPIVLDHDVAWFNQSAQPGEGENIALWGHVLRFRHAQHIPAPFARMKELAIGDRVTVYDDQGRAYAYAVTQRVLAKPYEVEYILPRGREMVSMVSCYGDRVISNGEVVDMTQRLIVIAEPVG
jgi:hypothetical protein